MRERSLRMAAMRSPQEMIGHHAQPLGAKDL
jgi:hypothetical protein